MMRKQLLTLKELAERDAHRLASQGQARRLGLRARPDQRPRDLLRRSRRSLMIALNLRKMKATT